MGSDAFFKSFAAEAILGGKVEFAFLDGLHLAEFLLRDFINTERVCRANSVIAIHDCFPLDVPMARRHETGPAVVRSGRYPDYWTGDVWKFMAALRIYRPALQVYVVDAQPTGLVLVTGLEPQSTILQDNYYNIVNGFRAATDADLVTFSRSVELMNTAELVTYEDVSRYFWL